MKLKFIPNDGGGFSVEYEPPPPMPKERFRAVCRLLTLAIGGTVAVAALIVGGVIPFAGALFAALIAAIIMEARRLESMEAGTRHNVPATFAELIASDCKFLFAACIFSRHFPIFPIPACNLFFVA